MWYELYTMQKLRELGEERLARRNRHPRLEPRPLLAPRLLLGPVFRRAGRALRRFGEALECWDAPCPDRAADGEVA